MQATDDLDTYFYVHTLAVGADGKLRLLKPDRIDLPGQQIADDSSATQTHSEFMRDNPLPIRECADDVERGQFCHFGARETSCESAFFFCANIQSQRWSGRIGRCVLG
jgi:hypothetical protein